jgi:hypothetical protein
LALFRMVTTDLVQAPFEVPERHIMLTIGWRRKRKDQIIKCEKGKAISNSTNHNQ